MKLYIKNKTDFSIRWSVMFSPFHSLNNNVFNMQSLTLNFRVSTIRMQGIWLIWCRMTLADLIRWVISHRWLFTNWSVNIEKYLYYVAVLPTFQHHPKHILITLHIWIEVSLNINKPIFLSNINIFTINPQPIFYISYPINIHPSSCRIYMPCTRYIVPGAYWNGRYILRDILLRRIFGIRRFGDHPYSHHVTINNQLNVP